MSLARSSSITNKDAQCRGLAPMNSYPLSMSRPKISTGLSSSGSLAPPARSYHKASDQVIPRGGADAGSSTLNNSDPHTQKSVQSASKSEVRYKRIESSCRLVLGKMVYKETEEFERVTYPAPRNPRARRAVRFAPSPTSTDFDLPPEIGTGPHSPNTAPLVPQTRSRYNSLGRDSLSTVSTTRRDRAPLSTPSSLPPYSYPLPSTSSSQLEPYNTHTTRSSYARVASKAPVSYNSHWDSLPVPYHPSTHLSIPRRPSISKIGHGDLMRAEAERLSSCLTLRPASPPHPDRPTGDFFLFSPTKSIPGFQIVRKLGPIRNQIVTLGWAQERVRRECENEEQMRGVNAVVDFWCEPIDRVRKQVRVSGFAVEVCPAAPRAELMHEVDE
ncbi:hypothetical protein CROQUDRAFT_130052 [Cronartium quercuum f. sp. fusiforme G11]|uniref:Uncharacterized protein n=1 Tax=Cronartium quercuum f. sp. fusiforme G11 TaxID=708437 RepID=A0A9P6NQ81_9BASI|nr:hypothetical protein CROQUDRAFT_130052 [Cronartium quercuum f. sp. fusiforme G11]